MIAPTTAAKIDPISPPAPIPNKPKQPAADQRADNADHDIADKAKAAPLHDESSKPPGDGADQQENNETCECHVLQPPWWRALSQPDVM